MYSPQVLKTRALQILLAVLSTLFWSTAAFTKEPISAKDVFKIAYASNPVMSPDGKAIAFDRYYICLLYTSPSPRDEVLSRMPSSA